VAQPQALSCCGRDLDSLIIDGQDSVERCPPIEGNDGLHCGVGRIQRHDHGPVAEELGQGLRMLGADHDVNTQTSRRG
jgi:hypothetical protein